jgi:heme oxygenase-like protein
MLEWLEISNELTLVATATRAFLHAPHALGVDPFRLPMRGAGAPETTHWLLEGAVAAAGRTLRAPPDEACATQPSPEPVSPPYWAYRLAGYYHTTDATRRLLPLVAQRFAAAGRAPLVRWAEQKIAEEAGHEQLALRDLRELGYRAEELVQAFLPPRAAAWVALFEGLAAADDPVGCVGYAHALERLALLRGAAQIDEIERGLPQGVNATRCLHVHSALGSDAHHVRSNVTTTAALSAAERGAVVKACYLTAGIYFDPTLDDDFHSARLKASVLAFSRARSPEPEALSLHPIPTSN